MRIYAWKHGPDGAALLPSRWNVRTVLLLQTVWHSSTADHERAFKELEKKNYNTTKNDTCVRKPDGFYRYRSLLIVFWKHFFFLNPSRKNDKNPRGYRKILLCFIHSSKYRFRSFSIFFFHSLFSYSFILLFFS